LRERGEWWTRVQTLGPEELAAELSKPVAVAEQPPKPEGGPAPSKRRRRRGGRGRSPKTASSSDEGS